MGRVSADDSMAALVAGLAGSRALRGSLAYRGFQPGVAAVPASLPAGGATSPLDVGSLLASAGIQHLYSHLSAALTALASGRNVLTVTPTASGKSLIYMLPTL